MQKHPDTYLVSEGANTLDIGRDLIGMQKPRPLPLTWYCSYY